MPLLESGAEYITEFGIRMALGTSNPKKSWVNSSSLSGCPSRKSASEKGSQKDVCGNSKPSGIDKHQMQLGWARCSQNLQSLLCMCHCMTAGSKSTTVLAPCIVSAVR